MKIVVYGAGNIGSLYAAMLARSGHDVSLLARGGRLKEVKERGIVLEKFPSGERTSTPVRAVEVLDSEEAFDLVMVVVPKNRVPEVLPTLTRNQPTPSFLFFSNNAEGPQAMIDAVGKDRVLLGFPGAAGVQSGDAIRYLITSKQEQMTTIGELDGRRTERIEEIAAAFNAAGFPTAICPNMDAWLKTHVAEVNPTANALLMAGGDRLRLAEDQEALRLMMEAIREGHRVLHSLGIPITPGIHRIFDWMPKPLLLAITRRKLASDEAAIKIGHALAARAEMKLLAEEFRALAERTDIPTPAIDLLYQYVDLSAAHSPPSSKVAAVRT